MNWLKLYTQRLTSLWTHQRSGEIKLAQKITFPVADLSLSSQLEKFKAQGGQFVFLGINEDIGPQGNLGRGGSGNGFEATIKQFINFQSNEFLNGQEILILGEIQISDLAVNNQDLNSVRDAVSQLDKRVIELVSIIKKTKLEPIVIGGGHNNAYGLLMACSNTLKTPMSAVNLDPHSDFRAKEGRHSGNGFSYAASDGGLAQYHVLGLHELKNNAESLQQLKAFGGTWHTFQQIWVRREVSLEHALLEISRKVNISSLPLGLELDVDAITQFPSSAETSAGIPLLDAAYYISYIARHCDCQYLHLAEAAPICHPSSEEAGYRQVGQSLSELVYAYIQGRNWYFNNTD